MANYLLEVKRSIVHDISNDTVAPLVVENVAYNENNNVHRINNREQTDEQRHRIVKRYTEEKTRGKHFIKRVKGRWDTKWDANSCENSTKPNR